jgi:hypothetical protein
MIWRTRTLDWLGIWPLGALGLDPLDDGAGKKATIGDDIASQGQALDEGRKRCLVQKPARAHIIMDNYATHKTPAISAWLARRPHYHAHFTPTSASWINQVERWFAELTRKKLRRGVHTSTRQLEADIRSFIERHNENPKPYKGVKSADEILAAVKRFCQKAEQTLCCEL